MQIAVNLPTVNALTKNSLCVPVHIIISEWDKITAFSQTSFGDDILRMNDYI